MLSGTLTYMTNEGHPDRLGLDQWMMLIVLGTILGYLQLRSYGAVIAIFFFYYMAENIVFYAWRAFTRNKECSIAKTHKRDSELLLDPLIFLISLFVAWYMIDYSAIGYGVGRNRQVARDNVNVARAVLIICTCFLCGYQKLYWITALLLLAITWIFHLALATPYSLWLSVRTSIVIGALFLFGFLRPFRGYFFHNALCSLFSLLWFTSMVHFISINQA